MVDWVEPNICLDRHIGVDEAGLPRLQPWSVPRLVGDVKADSSGDGKLTVLDSLPGKLLIQASLNWKNNTPVPATLLITVTRGPRYWVTSQPNAIQFRDRYTYAVDREPEVPNVTGIYSSQVGSAIDQGTNSVAEPKPGRQWVWTPTHSVDDWVARPLDPGQQFSLRYRCYVWTPPPWTDNANKSSPQHEAYANWSRLQLWAYPMTEVL